MRRPLHTTLLKSRSRLGLACLSLGLLSGCEKLLDIQDPVPGVRDGGSNIDASTDAGLSPSSPLLLSEVVLAPSPGEMIEIANTSNQEVDLSTYYVTDSGGYYTLPAQAIVQANDFIVKFPVGAKLAGHGVLVVAIDTPTNFAATYGKAPSYSVVDGSMQTIAMNGQPTLTNEGEPVILFQWDGRSDLIRDVDIMLVGKPSTQNDLPNKSGLRQDGPDADMLSSAYAADRHTISSQPSAPGSGLSTKRIQLETGHEAQDGTGNGQSGDDETSEDTSATWDTAFTAPDPFTVDFPQ
jgi:lamin tail-like protein